MLAMRSRRLSLILQLLALPALIGCSAQNEQQAPPPPLPEAALKAVTDLYKAGLASLKAKAEGK